MVFPIPFTYQQEEKPAIPTLGIRRWRYVLEVAVLSRYPGIGVTMQVKFENQDWSDNHASGFGIHLDYHWSWEENHVYWDGPHCGWNYGFLRLFRGGDDNCKKCNEEL